MSEILDAEEVAAMLGNLTPVEANPFVDEVMALAAHDEAMRIALRDAHRELDWCIAKLLPRRERMTEAGRQRLDRCIAVAAATRMVHRGERAAERTNLHADWTADAAGRSNSSSAFLAVCDEVERLIRDDAYTLSRGCADRTARLIVARLAHLHGLIPMRGVGDET